MHSNDGTLYVIRPGSDDDGWVTPEPVADVVAEAVAAAGDLDADDLADLSSYVDRSALAVVLDEPDGSISFTVEGHAVDVASDGTVEVRAE